MHTRQQGLQPLPVWESEQVFFSATQWFTHLLADIANATQSIDVQTYIFDLDRVGKPVLHALCAAAGRGIRVRIIVDGVGSAKSIATLQEKFEASHVQMHIYHPLPWAWVSSQLEKIRAFRAFLNDYCALTIVSTVNCV